MPERTTFWNWCISDDDLSNKVVRARENGVEAIMDETLEIADDKAQDTVKDESGAERPNTEWISRSRLRVETRHKYAQMIAPRKYGAKLDLTSGGEPIRPMDDTEKLTRLASIFAKAEAREPDSGAE